MVESFFTRFACRKNRPLPLLLLILWYPAVIGAQVTANAAFDRPGVETGDTFSLRILVKGVSAAPKSVDFSGWKPQLPPQNILSKSAWTRSGAHWVQRFTLISFDSARLQLPPLTIRLHLNDTILTNELSLIVQPTAATAEIRDIDGIRDIKREPVIWTDYLPWMAAILVLFILLIWVLRRRFNQPKPVVVAAPPPGPPPPTAQAVALQKLAVLAEQKPWTRGETGAYYAELSFLLREYLENRYRFPALESTTREIAALLKNTPFPESLLPVLFNLLQKSDLVKYAEIPPSTDFHVQALQSARDLVEKT